MKLAHYVNNSTVRVGLVEGERVFDLAEVLEEAGLTTVKEAETIDQMLASDSLGGLQKVERKITAGAVSVPVESTILQAPILNPEKILLVARNYLSHNVEQNARPPSEPYFFMKTRNALIGSGEPILIPKVSRRVDWEGELAVIIGKTGKNVRRMDAMEYVAGYTVSNDVSFRDLQFSTRSDNAAVALGSNWVKGKNLDSSFSLGPWLVTVDEIPDPQNLELSLKVNGEIKQHSNTREMIFKVDRLIEYVSSGMTLRHGDIISTGTPEGVAEFTGQPFLKDGDVVEVTIGGIGTLRNPVRSE
jgi:2-keto-4-pentenoate hydratase/2-oxohepta-3-ene-1,7-dioic acid hydratase in catechol pathway